LLLLVRCIGVRSGLLSSVECHCTSCFNSKRTRTTAVAEMYEIAMRFCVLWVLEYFGAIHFHCKGQGYGRLRCMIFACSFALEVEANDEAQFFSLANGQAHLIF